jgi:hypothetical protein
MFDFEGLADEALPRAEALESAGRSNFMVLNLGLRSQIQTQTQN